MEPVVELSAFLFTVQRLDGLLYRSHKVVFSFGKLFRRHPAFFGDRYVSGLEEVLKFIVAPSVLVVVR